MNPSENYKRGAFGRTDKNSHTSKTCDERLQLAVLLFVSGHKPNRLEITGLVYDSISHGRILLSFLVLLCKI